MVQVNVPLAKHLHWRSHRQVRMDAQVVGQTGLTTVGVGTDEVIVAGGCEGQESAGGEMHSAVAIQIGEIQICPPRKLGRKVLLGCGIVFGECEHEWVE
jgi:hypothetical protein